jgi:Flp pilus assembly pilin Flp
MYIFTVVHACLRQVLETLRDDDGQDMIEYALLASLLSIVAMLILLALGPYVQGEYLRIAAAMQCALGAHSC